MPRPRPLPIELLGGPFTTTAAHALGVTRARLRASDLSAPFHGVHMVGGAAGIPALARAAYARLLPGQYFSHTTAAVLLGFRMPERFDSGTLHVTSTAPRRAPRIAGVIGHQAAAPANISLAGGLPVSSPVDTWCQLATMFGLEDLIAAGDGLVCRIRPLSTLDSLKSAAENFTGRGATRLRDAAQHVRPGTDSHRETSLRRFVLASGFPEPEVNGMIRNSYGAVIAHGDLVFRTYRAILEYDGGQHRESDRQFAIDIDRLDALMEDGWRVIRVDKYLLARGATLVAKIDTALRQGGWQADRRTN